MTEKTEGGLSAAEEAYFNTGGEASLTPEQQVQEPVEKPAEAAQPQQPETPEQARDEKGRFVPHVPHQVFHAEREERKRIAQERDEYARRLAAFEERFKWAEEAKAPKAPEMPGDDDPIAQIGWIKDQLKAQQEQQRQAREQEEQQTRAQQEFARKRDYVMPRYNAAAEADPTVKDALAHVQSSYETELRAYGIPAHQIGAHLDNFAAQIIAHIADNNLDPAEFAKGLATARGWQPKQVQQQQKQLTLPEQLAKVAEAQQASRSVAQAAGAAAGQEMGLEQILAMSRPEFNAWIADPANERKFNRLMGA
jgi:hypothetical protein